MANIELNIVALGDFSAVNNQIKALQAQVAALNSGLGLGPIDSKLSASLKNAASDFSSVLTASNAFTKQTVQLTSETTKFGQALENGKLSLGQYFQIIRGKSGDATNSVKQLALEQTKLQNSVIMADPSKQGFYSVFTPTSINKISNATKIAANEANIYAMAVQKGSQSLINFGKNTQWAGRQLTVGMSVPLLMFGTQSTKVFQDVNNEIVRLQKVYGTGLTQPTQQALDSIKQQTLGLGRELASSMGVSVKDTAAMAADLAATGKTGNDLIVATREAMRLSKLGELDTQAAMKATVSLQNVYKLSTQDLSGAVNFLNAVENQTSTSLQDLVDGIPRVGPIVQQLGGSFKDTAVMMVAMKEAGVPAAQSANAIKSAIASLINPTKAAKEAFKAYNIDVASIATNNKGNPVKMIMSLQQALKGLQPLAQAQLIEKLFGKFQESRIQALITNLGAANSQTKTAFDLMYANNSQLAGVANSEMKTATQSVTGQYKIAVETFKADLLPLGEIILKIGTKLLNFANHVAKAFQGLPGPVKLILGILAGFVAISGPIIMLTGLLANFAGNVLKGVFNLKQLVTGGKTLGQLLTPELVAAQNASDLFSKGVLGDADAIKVLNEQIVILTNNLSSLVSRMGAGAGLPTITNALKSNASSIVAREAAIAEQMVIPGFADGGIIRGPGSGTSDSILAAVSNGETILTEKQTKKYAPLINAMVRGTIPGFAGGLSSSHTSMPFEPGSSQYESIRSKYPEMSQIESIPNAVKVLSNLVADLPQRLNTDFRSGIVDVQSQEGRSKFSSQWEAGGAGKFSTAAVLGGLKPNESTIKALADFEKTLKERIISLNKVNVSDQDLADETRKLIDEQIKQKNASGEVARALHNASQQVGQVRFAAGKDFIAQGLASGSLSMTSPYTGQIGTRPYLGSTPVGEVRSSGKFTGTNLNQMGGYQNLRADSVSVINLIKTTMKKAAGIASPSTVFNEEVGKPIGQGVSKGFQETLPGFENIATTSLNEVTKTLQTNTNSRPWKTTGEKYSQSLAQGITENTSIVELAATKQANSVIGKIKGVFTKEGGGLSTTGKLMGSMALMSAGPMISGMLPKGGVASSAVSNMSTYGSMGLMFGPQGAAIGAALGLSVTAITAFNNSIRESSNSLKSSFSIDSVAAESFGIAFKPLASYDFSKTSSGLKDHIDSINNNKAAVDQLTQAYLNSSDQMVKDDLNRIKGMSKKDLLQQMNKEYSAAMVQGATGTQAMQMVTSKMIAAGKSPYDLSYIKSNLTTPSNVNEAFNNLLKAGAKESAKNIDYPSARIISQTINKDKRDLAQGGMSPEYTKKTKAEIEELSNKLITLNNQSIVLSQKTLTGLMTNFQQLTTGPIKNFDTAIKSLSDKHNILGNSVVNNERVYSSLAIQMDQSWPGFQNLADKFRLAGGKSVDLLKAITLLNSGLVDQKRIVHDLSTGDLKDLNQVYADNLANIEKIQAATGNGGTGATGASTIDNTPKPFVETKLEKETKKKLEANLKVENAQLKSLREQLKVQTQQTQELDRQHQYMNSMTDLANQQKEAMISGNYLQAAGLGQQSSYLTMQYNNQTKQNQLQGKIDLIQSKADIFTQALADLATIVANSSTKISQDILNLASPKNQLRASGIKVNSAGNVVSTYNINNTINAAPNMDINALSDHVTKKTIKYIQTVNAKNNKTNHVRDMKAVN